jgi:hypothetical protein
MTAPLPTAERWLVRHPSVATLLFLLIATWPARTRERRG